MWLISTVEGIRTTTNGPSSGYDANAPCEFHYGTPGHSIENCKALKYKAQDLIYSKEITFVSNGLFATPKYHHS